MVDIISIGIGFGAGVVGSHFFIKRQENKLGNIGMNGRHLLMEKQEDELDSHSIVHQKNPLATKTDELLTTLAEADNAYQRFMQTNIDPFLGRKRQDYIALLAADNQSEFSMSKDERTANHRLAIGGLALIASGLAYVVNPAFMWLSIGFGLITASYVYEIGYQQWKRTRRLGAIHIIGIYLAFLWLGGYAAIGALGVIFISVGFKIKAITEEQSRNNLLSLFQIQPDTVWVRQADGIEVEIPFDQLQVGDTLVLQAGQTVPVDGSIIAGEATIDQHMLTGESQPAEKMLNEQVLASTVILSGKIDVRVEKAGSETTAGQVVALLNEATNYNSAESFKALEMADRFAWPTLILSAASWPLIGTAGAASLLGSNFTTSTYITNPLAMLNFFNAAAENGVLIKDGAGLDKMGQIDTIVFDKTGTLTLEQLQVVQLHSLSNTPDDQLLRLAAAAEKRQSHPIAQAILAAAEARQLELPIVDQAHYEIGYGLKVWLPEGAVRVGSQRFMTMENIPVPKPVDRLNSRCQATGHSLVMVALDEQLIGCIELQPMIRPESTEVVNTLRKQDLSLYIISGDQEAPTRKLAEQFGMTGYFANTLPEQKADLVAQLQQEGRSVCFIGDGINDALAMRQADVSISLRGATSAATDTAQIILMDGNLTQLPYLFEIGQAFEEIVHTNFNFTISTSLVSAGSILLAGFSFGATQFFYIATLFGGLGIAMLPMLEYQDKPQEIKPDKPAPTGWLSKIKEYNPLKKLRPVEKSPKGAPQGVFASLGYRPLEGATS
ncbi:MAG: heavy metal translocating P-type ATPase [Chloroflexota bacterium]